MDTLLVISIVGAAIDVLPWLLYDITETGQKSMIRVIRIRTIVEDRDNDVIDEASYLEGCEAVFKAKEYFGKEKINIPDLKSSLKMAKALPQTTDNEKDFRRKEIELAKKNIASAEVRNEEIEIAEFVMHELNRFENDFGKKQLELCRLIVDLGPQHFYECWQEAQTLANALPVTEDKEERTWRKQEIRNAKSLVKSMKMAKKHYPDGIIPFDNEEYENAYNMPDDTKEQAKARRQAMKIANKKKNLYASVAAPYLTAQRTLDLYEGYSDLDAITENYDCVSKAREEKLRIEREETEKLKQERQFDKESKKAKKKLNK